MEIIWSPFHDNEFILYGNNILLYRIISIENSKIEFMYDFLKI
jgi:hypothetical protein